MGAQEIKDALDHIEFDRSACLRAIVDFAVTRGFEEIDEAKAFDGLIDLADRKGLIKFYMDEIIMLITAETAHEMILKVVKGEAEEWLAANNLQEKIDELLWREDGAPE